MHVGPLTPSWNDAAALDADPTRADLLEPARCLASADRVLLALADRWQSVHASKHATHTGQPSTTCSAACLR